MKQLLSPSLVKNALGGHAWLGLLTGVLMYLICLSGALAVFFQEFERWEQPEVDEFTAIEPAAMERAYHEALERGLVEDSAFLMLPYRDMPRASLSAGEKGWWINQDGSLGPPEDHEWSHLLTSLHIQLHLPSSFGIVVVSVVGALLCGLILSGFLAHPRVFRDAFVLRLRGSKHLEQADIHNRLSVWAAPFHLMIAVTGAYFGLALLVGLVLTEAFLDGDRDALIPTVFGEDPVLEQPLAPANIAVPLQAMPAIAPEARPFFVVIEKIGTPGQFVSVGAEHAGRLTFAEQYQFDSEGNYLRSPGLADGEPGRQVLSSIYRLHTGIFGVFAVKMGYALLGLALTVVSVTGINIWLARRRQRDALNNLWLGFVWGAPPALAVSAIAQVIFDLPSAGLFWGTLVICTALAQALNDEPRSRALLHCLGGLALLLLCFSHVFKFKAAAFAPAALGVNLCLLIIGLAFMLMAGLRHRRLQRVPAKSMAGG